MCNFVFKLILDGLDNLFKNIKRVEENISEYSLEFMVSKVFLSMELKKEIRDRKK